MRLFIKENLSFFFNFVFGFFVEIVVIIFFGGRFLGMEILKVFGIIVGVLLFMFIRFIIIMVDIIFWDVGELLNVCIFYL